MPRPKATAMRAAVIIISLATWAAHLRFGSGVHTSIHAHAASVAHLHCSASFPQYGRVCPDDDRHDAASKPAIKMRGRRERDIARQPSVAFRRRTASPQPQHRPRVLLIRFADAAPSSNFYRDGLVPGFWSLVVPWGPLAKHRFIHSFPAPALVSCS
jgi:hypothetical protein